jgi:hypothetical protein
MWAMRKAIAGTTCFLMCRPILSTFPSPDLRRPDRADFLGRDRNHVRLVSCGLRGSAWAPGCTVKSS